MSILSTNVDQKKLETEFLIAINSPAGDKWQSKTLVVAISDPRSSIFESFQLLPIRCGNKIIFFYRNMKNVNYS